MSFIQPNNSYALINAKGGTCLDLSGGDNRSIIGYDFHNSPNQAWTFESTGANQTFDLKSVGGNQSYLNVAGEVCDGQKVVGSNDSFAWFVEDVQGIDNGVRLSPSNNTNFCVDLSDFGNSTPGTPIELWGRWDGQNQVWKAEKIQ